MISALVPTAFAPAASALAAALPAVLTTPAAGILDAPERLLAMAGFAFAGTWTPGPNNIMLANSGARFGFRRTTPHALGVAFGFPVMAFLVALGLGELFKSSDLLREAMKWIGAALLLYLAYRIATAGGAKADKESHARPFTFLEAVGFQWINPKAWMMAIGVVATYTTGAHPVLEAAAVAGVFVLAGLSSAHGWAGFGAALRDWLSHGSRLALYNAAMGGLLALFVIPILLDA